ncbi:MAG: ATP-binding cassette domain-containing protein [Verrucomicrobiales bacterium]|nr:ATP-binding cassette domain-containing protein [Verrucomicrobiales bacterium]
MIKVKGLRKHFGPKVAVAGVSFEVKKGEVLGFLGPNGAGKSTTMRMVTGYLPPTEGRVTIGGADILEEEITAKSKIGYLPEAAPLYSDMTVEGFLRFCAEMRQVPVEKINEAVDKAIATCFLDKVRHQSVDTLSKGFRHRTCLAQSIIHDPEVLILDEPTDGLDPNQKHEVRALIKRMGKEKAIIFSTHILEEVEAVCTRAIIIDRGKIIADGTPDELKAKSSSAGRITLKATGQAGKTIQKELEKLSEVGKVQVIESDGDGIHASISAAKGKALKLQPAVFKFCKDKGLSVSELSVDPGRLDDLFREITKSDRED